MTASKYANQILDMITDENGNVIETIKIITHSMGSAFGKGFVRELLRLARKRGIKGVPITLVADFDPFQAGSLEAEPSVFTQQFTQAGSMFEGGFENGPWLANQTQSGVDEEPDTNNESSHKLASFLNNINQLREGTYKWNGKEWKCTSCKE